MQNLHYFLVFITMRFRECENTIPQLLGLTEQELPKVSPSTLARVIPGTVGAIQVAAKFYDGEFFHFDEHSGFEQGRGGRGMMVKPSLQPAVPLTAEIANGLIASGATLHRMDTMATNPKRCLEVYRYLSYEQTPGAGAVNLDDAVALWSMLGDCCVDEDGVLEDPFLLFPAGSDREDVWHWFESVFSLSVAEHLMFKNHAQETR